MKRKGFTLIELLIAIAVVGILTTVALLAINPSEMFKQGRDSRRVNAISSLDTAITTYATDPRAGFMGNVQTVYISIPDPTATTTAGTTCAGVAGLFPLPSGWSYHCAATSTYTKLDGTGWVPINLTSMSIPPTIGSWPVDPSNTTTTYLYYTYVTDTAKYQLTAHFESSKNQPLEVKSGGYDPMTYTAGSNLSLAQFVGGLVAYYPMTEGSGATTADLAGYGYTGNITNATWISSGCNGTANCLSFNGTSAYVNTGADSVGTGPTSVCAWMWQTSAGNASPNVIAGDNDFTLGALPNNPGYKLDSQNDGVNGVFAAAGGSQDAWQHVCATKDAKGVTNLYINGANVVSNWAGGNAPRDTGRNLFIGADNGIPVVNYWKGRISSVRIYERVLSDTEVQSLYGAGG